MGTLTLLNDVSTDYDEVGLLVGDADPAANMRGQEQADLISDYFLDNCPLIEFIYSSDATRLKKLVHKIRVNSKDSKISSLTPRVFEAFRERSFGILNKTPLSTDSDVFSLTRIKPEKGESVFECRVRVVEGISTLLKKHYDRAILIVSHPFVCQIAFNALLQRDHTLLTNFWQDKGSFVTLKYEHGSYGAKWSFINGHNAISNRTYTQNEIYRDLLGAERSLPS